MPLTSISPTSAEHRGLRAAPPHLSDHERWFHGSLGQTRRVIPLLDSDPDFGRLLTPEEREIARRHVLVTVQRIDRGRWRPRIDDERRPLGFVVLSGSLIRGRRVEDRWSTELLGPEDILQPWAELPPPDGVKVDTEWTALEPVQMALLDQRFAAAAGRWPGLLEEVIARALRRSRLLATLLSVSGIRRLDDRILVLLRLLADRWGVVTPDGVLVRLRLTHETLARLACAQRPSVSTALSRLHSAGVIERRGRQFLLRAPLPAALEQEVAPPRAA